MSDRIGTRSRRLAALLLLAGSVSLIGGTEPLPAAPAGKPDIVSVRRLTQEQYRRSIAVIFGDDIKISAHLEPDPRREGLVAIGVAQASVTASGFEQYDAAAREIAEQITDRSHRDMLIGCGLAKGDTSGTTCIRGFISRTGHLLYRRPLQASEIEHLTDIATQAIADKHDFHGGLAVALASMLESPAFLFRVERAVWSGDRYRIDDASLASRLSFLLWNAPPDERLLTAAEKGDLRSAAGLAAQVDRLLASPRLEQGVAAFFSDMLALDQLGSVQKDPIIYPRFSPKLAADAREQALRTIVDTLVRRDAPYGDLFTTHRTFVSRTLGLLYGEPVARQSGWEAREYPADDPRAGLLTLPALLMTYSHPGRSSPVLRGKAIRELLLCQPVPPPPPNVNFAIVQDVTNPRFATARQRDAAHNNDPSCSGCHKLMDPLGLTLENFDGTGAMRTHENGEPIDLSGELNGVAVTGAAGLGRAIAEDPASSECLASRIYAYGVGRPLRTADNRWFRTLMGEQVAGGLRLRRLMRAIATSAPFLEPQGGDTQVPPSGRISRNEAIAREVNHGA